MAEIFANLPARALHGAQFWDPILSAPFAQTLKQKKMFRNNDLKVNADKTQLILVGFRENVKSFPPASVSISWVRPSLVLLLYAI